MSTLADQIEVHLSPGDLERHLGTVVSRFRALARTGRICAVHAPEQYVTKEAENPQLLDLAAANESVRATSIERLESTLELAADLNARGVVVHPGAIVTHGVAEGADRDTYAQRLSSSLERLQMFKRTMLSSKDATREMGAAPQIWLENMPWFYFIAHTNRHISLLCRRCEEFHTYLSTIDGIVLDISHGYFATRAGGEEEIFRFIEELGPMIAHIHVADSKLPDREGVQLGDGELDIASVLTVLAPAAIDDAGRERGDIVAIPEIWGGFRNGGEGFRIAIQRLRSLLHRCGIATPDE